MVQENSLTDKVSIIVPIYNPGKYLTACIESLINQDYANTEIILINDGSSDDSSDIAKRYITDNVIFVDKVNEGVSKTRNLGLKRSSGELIMFVDADDILPRNSVSTLVKAMKESNADYVCGMISLEYNGNIVSRKSRVEFGEYHPSQLLGRIIDDGTLSGMLLGSVCASLYKKEIIDEGCITFSEKICQNEDGLFNIEYILQSEKLKFIPDCTYYYRQYAESTSKRNAVSYELNNLIRQHIEYLDFDKEKYGFQKQMKARDVSIALWHLIIYPRQMKLVPAYRYIKEMTGRKDVEEGIKHLDYHNMPKYKLVYALLIKWHMNILLCLIIKYIQPFVMAHLKR